jgi:hypothetical protein
VAEFAFGGLGLIPDRAAAKIPDGGVSWDYTTWLNIAFLLLAAVLVVRFARTGGAMMPKMMGGAPGQPGSGNGHAHHGMHAMADGHGPAAAAGPRIRPWPGKNGRPNP